MNFNGASFGGAGSIDATSSGTSAVQFRNANEDNTIIKKKEQNIALVTNPEAQIIPPGTTKAWNA